MGWEWDLTGSQAHPGVAESGTFTACLFLTLVSIPFLAL